MIYISSYSKNSLHPLRAEKKVTHNYLEPVSLNSLFYPPLLKKHLSIFYVKYDMHCIMNVNHDLKF